MASQQDPSTSGQPPPARKRPLTSAEKQRNYRERLKQCPEKYERFKQKEAERQRERTRTRERTAEEIAYQRMKWRERVRKHRLKKKLEALNKRQFQNVFSMSESTSNVLPVLEGFVGTEIVAPVVNLNQDSEFLQAKDAIEMNSSELNIGQYIMEAHKEHNFDESKVVQLECNTPEGDDGTTCEENLDLRDYFAAQYEPVLNENGFRVGQSALYDDGNVANTEEAQNQQSTGQTILSIVEGYSKDRESPKKRKRKPLTNAERQRNYIARLKAQPQKWEQHRKKEMERRRRVQEQNKMLQEVVSQGRKRPYQCRNRGKSMRGQVKDSGPLGGCSLPGTSSEAVDFSTGSPEESRALGFIQANADSYPDVNSSERKQCDVESYTTSDGGTNEGNTLEFECFAPGIDENETKSTGEGRGLFHGGKFIVVSDESGFGFGQSTVHTRGSQSTVREMQNDMLTNSSTLALVGNSHKPPLKRRPLTPAERQRNYRARLKEQPGKWEEYKLRDAERRKTVQDQNNLSEEAAVCKRKKETERKREYRRRKKDSLDFSARNVDPVSADSRLNQNDLGVNLARVMVEQCDSDTHVSSSGKYKENVVNVKLENTTPDMCDTYVEGTVGVRDDMYTHAKKDREVKREIKCEAGQSDVSGNGNLTILEEMQSQLLTDPSLSWPLGVGLAAGSSERRKPLTPAERQQQYRERLKAQPGKWEEYKAREAERRKTVQEQKRLAEAAALQKRIKARERQRAYRCRKREKKSVIEKGQAGRCPLPEESSNLADACSERTKGDTSDVSGNGNLTILEEMQSQLLTGPSLSWPIGGLATGSSERRKPLTPAERQQQYRERLKAQPGKWEEYKAREAERRKRMQEQKRLAEAAVLHRKIKVRVRQRAYRRKKREEKSAMKNKIIETGQAGMCPLPEESANLVDVCSERFRGGTGNGNATNQNKYGNTDYLPANHRSHFDMTSTEMKIGQYIMDTHDASNKVITLESNTPDGSDNSTHPVHLKVGNDHSTKDDVDPLSVSGFGVCQSAVCEAGGHDPLLKGPSTCISSPVKGLRRRGRKRRRPMTAAERQRNYRARRKARLKREEQQRSSDTEGHVQNVHDPNTVSVDTASQSRKKATDSTLLKCRKGDGAGSETHGKSRNTSQADVLSVIMDPCFTSTRTTRSTAAAWRQQNGTVKNQETTEVNASGERDERILSSTEKEKQLTEAQLAYKRMKGRERMRKYRLRKKQKLKNACGGFEEDDMPRIAAVWSMSESNAQEENMGQKDNTEYFSSNFDNSVQVCDFRNIPRTNAMVTHDLAKIVPQDDMVPLYGNDSSPFFVHPVSNANLLANSDTPTALPTPPPQPNYSIDQHEWAFEENAVSFQKCRMTSAERQRKYRERLQQDPEKWAAYKHKQSERYLVRRANLTKKQVDKIRRQCLLRTRRWRAKLNKNKGSEYITSDDWSDSFLDDISQEETQMLDTTFRNDKHKHDISNIPYKFVEFNSTASTKPRGRKRLVKSQEEIERLRQGNRERQRRHRAKKRLEYEQRMQCTSSFAGKTEPPVLADSGLANGVEESVRTINDGKDFRGQVSSQAQVGSGIPCSTQFRICPSLSSSELPNPRKRGRPRKINQIIEQQTTPVRKRRGRPPKQSPMKTEYCPNAATKDAIVPPVENKCHVEVLVSSAGNMPMVIKAPEVKVQQDDGLEEIPQVIPCDPPPEGDFDWGNVELDHFEPALEGDVSLDKVEAMEPVIPGEGEGGCVSGSARRKAFFPTRHDTADLTLNAAWVVETALVDP